MNKNKWWRIQRKAFRATNRKMPGLLLTCFLAGQMIPGDSVARGEIDGMRDTVVKIYATIQRENHSAPWLPYRPQKGTGSGFVISGKKILTNAHVVSDIRYLEVQKEGVPKRYRAYVSFIAHDCDLAVLQVEDPSFYEGTRPARFASELPKLNDEVTVVGYPMGGTRISITKGVVSRIDYSIYSHSAIDEHLVLQVDAAINPGNSGGPLTYKGKVIGLAFQGIRMAENIGYAIPLPVIERFMADLEDGTYHGYPELGAANFDTENPAMRKHLGIPDDNIGTAVTYVDPFGSAAGHLEPGDVLLKINGYTIARDATIKLGGNTVLYGELLERLQWDAAVTFVLWREGKQLTVEVPLETAPDPFNFRYPYDKRARYVIVGGLVFSPLSRGYLGHLGRKFGDPLSQQLLYYSQYAKLDALYEDRNEFVALIRRLPHPVNAYATGFHNGILNELNGRAIQRLADIAAAAKKPVNGYHVFRFEGLNGDLVLDASAVEGSETDILETYGVPGPAYLGEMP
jgi:S1-C subfamily serine protease